MKKGIFSMAVLAAMCVGGYFGHSAYQESKLTDLELANVEALSGIEEGSVLKACQTYCRNLSGYICVLETATGFPMYCDEMAAWNYVEF